MHGEQKSESKDENDKEVFVHHRQFTSCSVLFIVRVLISRIVIGIMKYCTSFVQSQAVTVQSGCSCMYCMVYRICKTFCNVEYCSKRLCNKVEITTIYLVA